MAFVELEVKEHVGVLTINRPEALNALNDEVIHQLDQVLDSLDLSVLRCLIVTGAGQKAFVAGADIAPVPYKVIEQMLHHPLTDSGIEKFKEDYCKVFGE